MVESERLLKIKSFEEKCKALKDLENGTNSKVVSEKYGVPKNTISVWLKNKRFCQIWKSQAQSLSKKGYWLI